MAQTWVAEWEEGTRFKTSDGPFRYKELQPFINPPARSPDAWMQEVAFLGLAHSAWLHGRRRSGVRGGGNVASFKGRWAWILNSSFSLELESIILVGPQFPYLKIEEIITYCAGFLYGLAIVAKNRWSFNGAGGIAGGGVVAETIIDLSPDVPSSFPLTLFSVKINNKIKTIWKAKQK